MKRVFKVTMEVPEGATAHECATFIAEAVQSMGGALRPPCAYGDEDNGDPMFGRHDCQVEWVEKGQRLYVDTLGE